MDCIEIDLISIVRDCLRRAGRNAACTSPTYDDDNDWARTYTSTFNALIALESARLSVPTAVLREQLSHPALKLDAEMLAEAEALKAQPKHDAHVGEWANRNVFFDDVPF